MITPQEQKERLRRQAAALPRAHVPHLLEQFLTLPQVEAARTVMVFCGVGREPDTTDLIDQLLAKGKQVVLPVCLPQRGMEARAITSQDQLIPNHYGIPEPDGMCPIVPRDEIDVVLVPNMMCDRAGYRLGQGGGYYDRWLKGYSGFTVSVCPAERLQEQLPHADYDVPVQLVLTDG